MTHQVYHFDITGRISADNWEEADRILDVILDKIREVENVNVTYDYIETGDWPNEYNTKYGSL